MANKNLTRLIVQQFFSVAVSAAWAAEQFWVGGVQGNWSDKAWADASGGEGGAWVSGNDAVLDGASASITVSSSAIANKINAKIDSEIQSVPFDVSIRESSYRYFRFYVDGVKENNTCMQFSEIQLFDENGVVIAPDRFEISYDPKEHGSPNFPSKESPEKAVDGDVNTKWLDWRAGTDKAIEPRRAVWLQLKMKDSQNPQRLSGYKWYTANDSQARDPASWRLLASNDGENWQTLDVATAIKVTSNRKVLAYQKFFIPFPKYRFKVDKADTQAETSDTLQISDVALYGADGRRFVNGVDFDLSSANGAPTGGEGVQKAVDTKSDGTGDTSTKWLDKRLKSNIDNVWIGFDLKSPEFVSKYAWYMANDTEKYKSRNPSQWRLQASYNGIDWHDLDTVTESSVTIKNFALAYERSFGSEIFAQNEVPVLYAEKLTVEGGHELSIPGNMKLASLGTLSKEGLGTLVLGKNGLTVNYGLGFSVSEGVFKASDATFRPNTAATAGYNAPFIVGKGGGREATAVLNGGSIYCISLESGTYNAMQIGADSGDIGYLYATNVNVVSRGRIRIGTGENSVAIVEKTGGDWKVQENAAYGRFLMGEGANSHSEFYHRSGTLETWSYICLGLADNADTYFELSGGIVTQAHNNDVRIGDIGNAQSHNEFCVKGGELNARADIRIANNASGILTVDGGLVNVPNGQVLVSCSSDAGESGLVTLNGGTIKTKSVAHGGGAEDGIFEFNGGTLMAVESRSILNGEKLKVRVGANGGIINNAGNSISIAADITGDGEISLVGAGATEISQSQKGSDVTFRIAEGICTLGDGVSLESSVVVAKDARLIVSKSALAEASSISSITFEDGAVLGIFTGAKPIAVDTVIMPEFGYVSLTTSAGTPFEMGVYEIFASNNISEDVEDKLDPLLAEGLVASFNRENGVFSMTVSGGNEAVWTGAAADNDLSNKKNWFLEMMPNGRPAVINLPTAAKLVCSSSISPTSIIFSEESAAATIDTVNGAVITVSDSVVNRSSSVQSFNAPVRFEGDVKLDYSGDTLVFAGGVSGNTFNLSGMDFGGWHLKGIFNLESWNGDYCFIDNGTVVNVKSAASLGDVRIEEGGSLVVGTYTIEASEDTANKWILYYNRGLFKVTGTLVNISSVTVAMFAPDDTGEMKDTAKNVIAHFINTPTADSDFLLGRYTNIGTQFGKWIRSSSFVWGDVTWGEHALSFVGYRSVQYNFNFEKSGRITTQRGDGYFGFLETTDFVMTDQSDVPVDVVFDCDIQNVNYNANYYGDMVVRGGGKLTLASGRAIKMHTKAVNISGTGTVLAIQPGASISAGKISVGGSSMFRVAGSGEISPEAGIELNDGAILGFEYSSRVNNPVLALKDDKPVTINGKVVVSISSKDGIRPCSGMKVLTTGGKFAGVQVELAEGSPKWVRDVSVNDDGNIVVDVKRAASVIRIR